MTLRRLCNVAFAVLSESLPREARPELGRRLDALASGPDGVETKPESIEDKAAANRKAMTTLLGMLPGGRPKTA